MKRILLAALVFAALPLAAQASDLDYNYLQAGYQYNDNSNSAPNGHGWSGLGSVALGPNFFLQGGGSHMDRGSFIAPNGDFRPAAGVNSWSLGGGFHTPVSANTDFVGAASYNHGDVDGLDNARHTYSAEVGVRSAMAPHLEGWISAGYGDGPDTKGSVFGKIGGEYKLDKNWGLVGQVRASRNETQYFVGPRVSF
jgi:Ax21 family sulfation-dependent quorum factor